MGSIATENEATAPRPTIAILGAGIGGLGLAIGLVRQNIPFILYEAAAQFSVVGAGVGLGPNAVRAMDHIDPRLKGLYDGIKTGNKTAAKKHAVFDALMIDEGFGVNHGWPGKSIVSTAYIRTSAHRKALLDCMVSLVPEKNVRFSKRAKDVKQVGDKAEVTFYDGAKISVDILIGCDGIKGVTRKAVLGDEFPDMVEPKYSNMYFYRGIMPIAAVAGAMGEEQAGDACMFMGVGRNMTFYPISQGKEMNYIACKYDPNPWKLDQWTEEVTTEDMLKDYENIDPGLNKLMETHAKPVRWATHFHPQTPYYYKSNICLLGDSAHATTPYQAAGGGQALESAMIMSHVLGKVRSAGDIHAAFATFDQIRRPRAQKVIDTSLEAGMMYVLMHPDTGADMQAVVDQGEKRLPWIWTHDLDRDLVLADELFEGFGKGV